MRAEMINGCSNSSICSSSIRAVAAVANVSPASITNGAGDLGVGGHVASQCDDGLSNVHLAFLAANPSVENMVLLMTPANAVAIARATNKPTLGLKGGRSTAFRWSCGAQWAID